MNLEDRTSTRIQKQCKDEAVRESFCFRVRFDAEKITIHLQAAWSMDESEGKDDDVADDGDDQAIGEDDLMAHKPRCGQVRI